MSNDLPTSANILIGTVYTMARAKVQIESQVRLFRFNLAGQSTMRPAPVERRQMAKRETAATVRASCPHAPVTDADSAQ